MDSLNNTQQMYCAAVTQDTSADQYSTEKLFDSAYHFLLLYYLEDLWSSPIYEEIMASDNPQQYITDFFAAKLQWDRKLQAIIAAASEKVEA